MNDKISLFICGDFYAGSVTDLKISPSLQNIISEADIAICNFEGPVRTIEAEKIAKSGPSLAQDPKAPWFLENAGFNVFLLGNNHFMDYGEIAARKTCISFKNSILVGAGTPSEAYTIQRIRVKEKTIGFMSLVQHEFGVVEKVDEKETYGTAWINSPDVRDTILKERQCLDYLLIFPHAGIEHIDAPLPEWREVYRHFIDWGADCVMASHPHVPQGWEFYNGRPILYSLGNFYFDTLTGGQWWSRGLAVQLSLGEGISVKIVNTKFSDSIIDIDESKKAEDHNEYLCSLLNDDKAYNSYIQEKCKQSYNDYIYGLLRSVNGTSFNLGFKKAMKTLFSMLLNKGNKNTLLNIMQCESHRWMLERGLKD
jgi:poly-gamma-glutamate synthesis protein (capsule biosynthesis protein)